MNWLVEGHWLVYLLLVLAAATCFLLYRRTQDRKLQIAGAALLGLAGAYAVLDLAVETDGEQVQRKVKAMARAVGAKDANGVVEHLAEDFRFAGFTKKGLQVWVDSRIKDNQVDGAEAWDFDRPVEPDVQTLVSLDLNEEEARALVQNKKALVGTFKGKVKGPQMAFYQVTAVFVREADGQWRLRTFKLSNPLTHE